MQTPSFYLRLLLILTLGTSAGCSTLYYEGWEKLGKQKRDLLSDRVEDAQEEQKELQSELQDALTQIKTLYGLDESKLETTYSKMKDSYDDAKEKADGLKKRIDRVETVGNDLFDEWEDEAKTLKNPAYRKDSEAKRKQSYQRYQKMVKSMRQAEKRVEPVMVKLHDQVIYLKHNLNAQALGSLKKEMISIETDINGLIKEMEKSIQTGDDFIKGLKQAS